MMKPSTLLIVNLVLWLPIVLLLMHLDSTVMSEIFSHFGLYKTLSWDKMNWIFWQIVSVIEGAIMLGTGILLIPTLRDHKSKAKKTSK